MRPPAPIATNPVAETKGTSSRCGRGNQTDPKLPQPRIHRIDDTPCDVEMGDGVSIKQHQAARRR